MAEQSQSPKLSLEDGKDKKLEILLGMVNNLKGIEELRDFLEKHDTDVRREKEDREMCPTSQNMHKTDMTGTPPSLDKSKVTLEQQLLTRTNKSFRVKAIDLPNNHEEAIFENIRGEECTNRSKEDDKKWNDAVSVITMETMEERHDILVTNDEISTFHSLFMSQQSDDIGVGTRGDCNSIMAKILYKCILCNSDNSHTTTSSLNCLANYQHWNLESFSEGIKYRSAEMANAVKEESEKVVNTAYDGMLDIFDNAANKVWESAYDVYAEAYWQMDDAKVYLWKVSKCGAKEVKEESTVCVEKWIKPTMDTIREQDIKQSVFVMVGVEQDVEVADGRGFQCLGKSDMNNEDRDEEESVMPRETNDEILIFMYRLMGLEKYHQIHGVFPELTEKKTLQFF